MAEQLNLTAPIPATTTWKVKDIALNLGLSADSGVFTDDPRFAVVHVALIGDNGRRLEYRYEGQAAHDDIIALNKANMSTTSFQKRILQKLTALGVISGTISGLPD